MTPHLRILAFLMNKTFLSALVASLASLPVFAVQPSDLDGAPVPKECTSESVNLALMLNAQDHGLTKDRALQIAEQSDKEKVSVVAIENAYKYPGMSHDGLIGYSLWACIASSYGVAPLPLSDVEADLDACARRRGDSTCGRQIRNRVWGLPATFVSKPRLEPQVPPRASGVQAVIRLSDPGCRPVYPEAALKAGVQGTSEIELTISENAQVVDSKVLKPSGRYRENLMLDRAAAQALSKCPVVSVGTDLDGHPITTKIRLEYRWALQ